MTKQTAPLNRTCLACGLEKPLAAFLQISGSQGTVYGNICSSCRTAGAKGNLNLPKPEGEEAGGGGTGLKIDSKTKIQFEFEKKQLDKKTKEITLEEKREREDLKLEKSERTEKTEKSEKSHRETYIEAKKKRGFLDIVSKPEKDKPGTSRSVILDDKEALAKLSEFEAQIQKEIIAQEEQSLRTPDIAKTPIRYDRARSLSTDFLRYKEWLGASSNFRRMELLYNKLSGEKEGGPKPKEDPLVNFVEKSSPSSRKKS